MQAIANGPGWPLEVDKKLVIARPAEDGPVRVAGDFNDWKPLATSRKGSLELVEVQARGPAKYKLVDHEGKWIPDRWSRSFGYDDHGEHSLARPAGAHLERYFELGGPGIRPRTIQLWIPRKEVTHHLYAHDGQNLFDPGGPHGSWRLQDSAGDHTLIVGINFVDRFYELTHTQDKITKKRPDGTEYRDWVGGGADHYMDFIHDRLRPFIEQRFVGPKATGVMGSSLGGLCSVLQHVRHPGRWDFVGALSATFGWGSRGLDPGDVQRGPSMVERAGDIARGAVIYLDSGGWKGAPAAQRDNYDVVCELRDRLEQRGFRHDEDLYHWHEQGAPHTEGAWRERVWRPLRIFQGL